MILFKSKQQVLSRTDLNQEHLKIEQHSTNLLGTLDAQVSTYLNTLNMAAFPIRIPRSEFWKISGRIIW